VVDRCGFRVSERKQNNYVLLSLLFVIFMQSLCDCAVGCIPYIYTSSVTYGELYRRTSVPLLLLATSHSLVVNQEMYIM
jgi:hypothetical protein